MFLLAKEQRNKNFQGYKMTWTLAYSIRTLLLSLFNYNNNNDNFISKLLVYIGYYHIVFMFRLSPCSGDLVHQVWVVQWSEPWLCGLGFKWVVKNGWWIGFLPGISSHFCRINCSINSFCSLSTFCKASCCTRNLIIKRKDNKMLLMIWT